MITLDQLATVLPKQATLKINEEAWELRYLTQHKLESISQGIIFAEYAADTAVLRLTVPAVERYGRVRIWLKRSLVPLTNKDAMDFINILNAVVEMTGYKLVLSDSAESLVNRMGGIAKYEKPSKAKTRPPRT